MTGIAVEQVATMLARMFRASKVSIRSYTGGSRLIVATRSRMIVPLVLCLATLGAGPSLADARSSAQDVPIPAERPVLERLEDSAPEPPAKVEPTRLRAWIATHLESLDRLLAKSGLDLGQLVAQAEQQGRRLSDGQGGPLVPVLGRPLPGQPSASRGGSLDLERLQLALRSVPLATPMTDYKLNSRFGYRRDPLNRRGAVHTGLDCGGPTNAPVLATAPGVVTEAGRAGAYGIMVVIDHGLGLETRYAHLRAAKVRVGQKVTLHQQVGIMGRTGRATGAHLHYEIRLDGRALNPAPFLEAGGQLRQLAGG
jgi:murein DD-endopeptidase MepM/ murein hydrolase activator NlpD